MTYLTIATKIRFSVTNTEGGKRLNLTAIIIILGQIPDICCGVALRVA
jgi:hypothetical protein